MIKSMLAHQAQSVHHMLPVWSHYANENWCMTGYHAVSVIADAAVKQVGDFDLNAALKATVSTANVRYFAGLGDYLDYHYVPEDKSPYSVTKTLNTPTMTGVSLSWHGMLVIRLLKRPFPNGRNITGMCSTRLPAL